MPSDSSFSTPKAALFLAMGLALGIGGVLVFQREPSRETPPTATPLVPLPRVTPSDAAPGKQEDARDPASVLADAISNSNRDQRAESLRHLAARLVEEDIASALAMGEKIPDANDRLEYTRALFAAWAARDPKAALAHAKAGFKPGILQSEAFSAAIEVWAGANPRAALQWTEANLSGPVREQAMVSAAQGWARNDPVAASGWFAATGSTSQTILNAIVATWADLNPRAAAAWIETLTDPENSVIARVSLASEWGRQDPAAAAAYFGGKLSGRDGADISSALVNAWGASDPAGAAEWILKMPAGGIRNEAAGALATIWVATDIDAAVKWSGSIEDAEIKAQVIDHLGTTWGAIEPRKALEWIATLSPGEPQTGALTGALDSWAATDMPGLAKWIASEPVGPRADLARESMAAVQIDRDPAAAMQTAMGAGDPALRRDLLRKHFRRWQQKDAQAAGAWLAGATLDVQATLQKPVK